MKKNNAPEILEAVNACIDELSNLSWDAYTSNRDRYTKHGWSGGYRFRMFAVCEELSIFDWWKEELSMSQLKNMKKFLETAIRLGFTGYVCFKVGAAGCAHGMWAHKEETTTGYSPDGDCLFHSFRSGDNYWDVRINNEWMHVKHLYKETGEFTLKEIEEELAM